MALIRWEPGRELQSFQHEVNRLFGTAFDSPTAGRGAQARAVRRWVPAIDIAEQENSYTLKADLPGLDEQDLEVSVHENVLEISGERRSESEESREGYRRVERARGRFTRSVRLPEGVDPESITAEFERGVLTLSIPKPERAKPHRVAVGIGSKAAVEATAPEAAAQDGEQAEPAPQSPAQAA